MTETQALISINGTLIVQLVSFLLFVFLLNRVMFRPLMDTIKDREAHVDRIKRDIKKYGNEIESLNKAVREKEMAIKAKANEIRSGLEDEGGYEATRILAAAKEEITAIKEKTQDEISAQIDEAKKSLKSEAETIAVGIMEKVLNRRLGK